MVSILNTVRDIDRARQIATVLVRHGFGEWVSRMGLGKQDSAAPEQKHNTSTGERLVAMLNELGPSFIKLGQIASTRSDLLPDNIIQHLRTLQEQAEPIPFSDVVGVIEQELGGSWKESFLSIVETPLASASIAQVHKATLQSLQSGDIYTVVVKVQRPGIKSVIERDLDLLHALARTLERTVPESRPYAPTKMVAEFERAIKAELDFVQEADHAEQFAKNFREHTQVKFPSVYRELSGRTLLTLEFLEGKRFYDAIQSGYSAEGLTKLTLGIMIQSVFEDGFFHADPHPGNVIIMGTPEAPVLGIVDLGLVGRLTPQLRETTIDLMAAVSRNDPRGMADALLEIGTPSLKIKRKDFEAYVMKMSDKYLGKTLGEIKLGNLLNDLGAGAYRFGLEIPPDFVLLGKTVMTVEGVGKNVAPHFDLYGEMKPYFLKLAMNRYQPDRIANDLLRGFTRMSHAASELPLQTREILDDLREGKLEIKSRDLGMAMYTDLLGRRLYSGLVVGALLLGSAILVSAKEYYVGVFFFLMAASWGFFHVVLALLKARQPRKK